MNYKEWITATLSRFEISAADIDLIIINQGICWADEVDVVKAKTALVKEFSMLIPLQSSISEGGYSLSWNWNAILGWYKLTCAELGIEPVSIDGTTKPTIRNKSYMW